MKRKVMRRKVYDSSSPVSPIPRLLSPRPTPIRLTPASSGYLTPPATLLRLPPSAYIVASPQRRNSRSPRNSPSPRRRETALSRARLGSRQDVLQRQEERAERLRQGNILSNLNTRRRRSLSPRSKRLVERN